MRALNPAAENPNRSPSSYGAVTDRLADAEMQDAVNPSAVAAQLKPQPVDAAAEALSAWSHFDPAAAEQREQLRGGFCRALRARAGPTT